MHWESKKKEIRRKGDARGGGKGEGRRGGREGSAPKTTVDREREDGSFRNEV